ncbi:hypothetical protein HPB48_008785 [Haemaphysalis longicornis]|uniref:Serine/threonine-protein phosphatase 6 regulatory subunit 3 n=1 Tax=Haemaphysalis longicornis TaxID=44386 RepID=A0A9J6H180_HAELO|nr:hypothetical protein HPB48_008785 [Haemaphysalis longicornis]
MKDFKSGYREEETVNSTEGGNCKIRKRRIYWGIARHEQRPSSRCGRRRDDDDDGGGDVSPLQAGRPAAAAAERQQQCGRPQRRRWPRRGWPQRAAGGDGLLHVHLLPVGKRRADDRPGRGAAPAGVNRVLAAVLPRLADFLRLLTAPPQKPSWTTTFGVLDPPLGQTRLEVCHLVNALINSNNDDVNKRLAELGALPYHSGPVLRVLVEQLLHTQVAQLVSSVISSAYSLDQEGNKVNPLLDQLLGSCTLVQRCLDAWDANTLEQNQPGKHRRGYMGHLTKIVNDIVAAADNGNNSELVRERLKDLPEETKGRWETFTVDTLAEVNKKNTVSLGGGMPSVSSSEDDECIDLREVGFHQEAALQQVFPRSVQQAFSDYQMEQVTSNFVEQFGFNDDEFVEADENLVGQLDQLARANFHLPSEVNMTLDDADSDDDIWDDKEAVLSTRRLADDAEEPNSSDSDDEGGPRPSGGVAMSSEEVKMDIDTAIEPDAVAMDTTSPWENNAAANTTTGWASFDNFANFGAVNFERAAETSDGPADSPPAACVGGVAKLVAVTTTTTTVTTCANGPVPSAEPPKSAAVTAVTQRLEDSSETGGETSSVAAETSSPSPANCVESLAPTTTTTTQVSPPPAQVPNGPLAELGRCWRVNVNRSTPPQFCCAFKRTSEVIAHSVGSESPPPSGVDA